MYISGGDKTCVPFKSKNTLFPTATPRPPALCEQGGNEYLSSELTECVPRFSQDACNCRRDITVLLLVRHNCLFVITQRSNQGRQQMSGTPATMG